MECISMDQLSLQQRRELLEDDGLTFYENRSKCIKVEDNIIGFYTTHILLDRLMLEYNLLKKYRYQGIGGSFVKYITELVFKDNPKHESIYLLIHVDNVSSIQVALQNEYHECNDTEFKEMIAEEMSNYKVYYKVNDYYQKPESPKQLLHKL